MSNAAGWERDQFGTRMSAGLEVLRKKATSFLNLWGKACLVAEVRNAVSELVVSSYHITSIMTSKHVMSPSIHVVMTKWAWSAIRYLF